MSLFNAAPAVPALVKTSESPAAGTLLPSQLPAVSQFTLVLPTQVSVAAEALIARLQPRLNKRWSLWRFREIRLVFIIGWLTWERRNSTVCYAACILCRPRGLWCLRGVKWVEIRYVPAVQFAEKQGQPPQEVSRRFRRYRCPGGFCQRR